MIRKLIFYTVMMATLPIAAYYASHDYIFHERVQEWWCSCIALSTGMQNSV